MTENVQTLRRQLQKLQELHDGGALVDAAYVDSKAALERRLLERVMSGDTAADTSPSARPIDSAVRPSRRLLAGLGAAIVAVAAAGYWWTGSPRQAGLAAGPARPASAAAPEVDAGPNGAHAVSPEQIADLADKLARRLEERPDDAEGWAMLARSYSVLGRHAEAVPAYEKAVALRGDDAPLLADYADALAVKNQGRLAGEPMKAVARALKLEPDNLKALSLAGTEAFDRKDYAGALAHWEHIVRVGPVDSTLVQQVRGSIAEAREQGGMAASPATTAAAPSAAGGAAVSGSVAIAPALAGRAGPDDTVFVFARAVDGPRMPLAVLRKRFKDLPFDFRLDDSMAMAGTARLSSAARVIVGVRVSKSGDALPAAGDLLGQSGPIALGTTGVRVEVAEMVNK